MTNKQEKIVLRDRQKWAFARIPRCRIIADVGSSHGPLCKVLTAFASAVVAIDTNKEELDELRGARETLLTVQASAMDLPLRDGSVDTLLLLDVLEHTSDDRRTVLEIHRVLPPGGTLILTVPHKGLFGFMDPQNLSGRLKGTPATVHRHYSMADLEHLLADRFRVVEKAYGGLLVFPMAFAAGNFVRKHFRVDAGWLFDRLCDWDASVSWGRMSYNLFLVARKA